MPRIVFIGTAELAVASLQALHRQPGFELVRVVTQPDRPQGRKLQLKPSPVKIAAEARMPRAIVGLRSMHEYAAMQLKDVLDAYAQRDVERARAVWTRDAELDALEDSVFRDLLTFMMEDPRSITFCTHLLFCSKNIERIGDHATNIAETVIYLVTGETLPVDRPKGAATAIRQ